MLKSRCLPNLKNPHLKQKHNKAPSMLPPFLKPEQKPEDFQQKQSLDFKSLEKEQLRCCWKKEIRTFMNTWMKKRQHRGHKPCKKQLCRALTLLISPSFNSDNSVLQQKKNPENPTCVLNHLKKGGQSACLILSNFMSAFSPQSLNLQLSVISGQAKILYNTIFIRSWQQLEKQLEIIKANQIIHLVVAQNKQTLLNLIPFQDFNLREYLSSLPDLQATATDSGQPCFDEFANKSFRINELCEQNSQYNYGNKIKLVLQLYSFIKKGLSATLKNGQTKENSQDYWPYISLAYNMVVPFAYSISIPFQEQIEFCQPMLQEFLQEISSLEENQIKANITPQHYPASLINAHHCWNCKLRRSYMSCSSCSEKEQKTISLCIDCYVSFHQNMFKQTDRLPLAQLLQKWQMIEQQTQLLMKGTTSVPEHPSFLMVKKEQES